MSGEQRVFKNLNFTKRDYELTNVVACVADKAPNENYKECEASELNGLDKLWKEGNVQYYGYI